MTAGHGISVLIPAFDAGPFLAEAIDSALGQTRAPLEVIVVDDGSTDDTAAVARSYGDRIRFAAQEHGGIGAARNRAVALARGDHLAFLDADDRYVPDKLERQLEELRRDPGLDVVFGHAREFVTPGLSPEARAGLRRPAPPSPFVAPGTMLIRREAFDRVGPFSTELRVGEGIDWCARASEAGLKSLTLPVVVLERRLHGQNTGIREHAAGGDYLRVVRDALARRRAHAG